MVSPPFGGTAASLPAILEQFPDNWPYPNVTDAQLHTMERSLGSTAMFLPRESAFGEEVFLTIDDQNFTAKDVREILGLSKLDHFWQFYAGDEPKPQEELPVKCIFIRIKLLAMAYRQDFQKNFPKSSKAATIAFIFYILYIWI